MEDFPNKIVVREYLKTRSQVVGFRNYCKRFGISTSVARVTTEGVRHNALLISIPELKLFLNKAQKSIDEKGSFHTCEGLDGGMHNIVALLTEALNNFNSKEKECFKSHYNEKKSMPK